MSKPRLFIPILTHFSVRYILRTGMLSSLAEFSKPLIGMGWEDPDLEEEFERVGAEIYHVPGYTFTPRFREIRDLVNFWHKLYRGTNTTDIDIRREGSLLTGKDRIYYETQILKNRIKVANRYYIPRMLENEETLFWTDTNYNIFDDLLEESKPDVIFSITPFVNREEPLLRCAQKRNITRYTSILSFDNVTSRTRLPASFDYYMVWNKYNADELLRTYSHITKEKIIISGPPQFDFYYDNSNIIAEDKWRAELELPSNRPIILFGGGTHNIVPNEPLFLKQLDEAISASKIPANPIILFRRHPGDIPERWHSILKELRNTRIDKGWKAKEKRGQTNITQNDVVQLCSTLAHCAVHINTSSTLTVDGSVFDRPQIGPAYDPGRGKKFERVIRDLYKREHYQPITHSGGLDLVNSRSQFIDAVNDAFENPAAKAEGRKKIVREICTFNDGQSTQRVVSKLKQLIS